MSSRADEDELDRLLEERDLRGNIKRLDSKRIPTAPWWSPRRRKEAAEKQRDHADKRARFVTQLCKLGPLTEEADDVARRCIDGAWRRHPKGGSWHHPYDPACLADLPGHAALVCEAARTHPVHAEIRGMVYPNDLRGVQERITPEAVESYVRNQVAIAHAKANDPRILTEHLCMEAGERALVVQHQATGIRALFTVNDQTGFGHVHAKHFEIPSIDHGKPENDVDRWFGLGVGTRLYRRAAEEFPEVRWGRSSTQDPADGVRRKLHAEDPWRWAVVSCAWCHEHLPNQDWRAASPADFHGHPGPEGAQ